MAEIRCPKCGNDNPDFLDVCQFCQSPLRSESIFHIGDEPTKKDTGELEEILPSWLKDARQQGRDEVADESLKSETRPKVQKNEAPDLLAGLAASQADSDEDEVPDWLASINPVADKTPPKPSSAKEDKPSDFFAQFAQSEQQPSVPSVTEPAQDDVPVWMGGTEQPVSEQKDELTDWFSQTSSEPEVSASSASSEPVDDNSWMNTLGSFDDTKHESPAEKEPEDLSWLHDLEKTSKQADDFSAPQKNTGFDPASPSSEGDLSWLNDLGGTPAPSFDASAPSTPSSSQDDMSWLNDLGGTPAPSFDASAPSAPSSSQDDLSWLNDLGGTPAPSFEEPAPSAPSSSRDDLSWLNDLGSTPAPSFEEPAPSQPSSSQDDLSWLDNLGGTPAPAFEEPVTAQPPSSQEDLNWLNNLAGTPKPVFGEPASSPPSSSQEDLSWLDNLGGTPAPAFDEPVTTQPSSSQEDLDWLNNLAGTAKPIFGEPAPSQPPSSGDDLSWLNNLGGTPASAFEEPTPSQPSSSEDDLSWLGTLGGIEQPAPSQPSASIFAQADDSTNQPDAPTSKPFRTAPLNELIAEGFKDTTPDWLKSAMEEPSMPAPGELSMDWLSNQGKSADAKPVKQQYDEFNASVEPEPVSIQKDLDLPLGLGASSTQDVDSLFDVEMPDWLSRESESGAISPSGVGASIASDDESLAPVELPSWVQAMRPVDSAIDKAALSSVDQVTEREGPLAGFRGVIPFAVIGSSLRPKAFSLKLQVSDEQQAGALLFEQILAGETAAQPLKPTSFMPSQRMLRWALSGAFVVVLALVLALGSQIIPIIPSNQLSDLIATVPDASPVLVVLDYEPSFAGELEATSGPLFDQMASSRHSTFSFVSMSPNGSALVDRLMFNTNISKPIADGGLGYQSGAQYVNLGFLPGGAAGVLAFIENSNNEFSRFKAIVLMTDNVESGRVWVEQLEMAKGNRPEIVDKPVFVVSSAQSGPMLAPYVSSGQVDILVNGLYDGAKYEYVNNTRPGIARRYWDAFGIGLFMAIIAIILGSIWNILMGIRERRAQAELG